jgi:hypothetical protein
MKLATDDGIDDVENRLREELAEEGRDRVRDEADRRPRSWTTPRPTNSPRTPRPGSPAHRSAPAPTPSSFEPDPGRQV